MTPGRIIRPANELEDLPSHKAPVGEFLVTTGPTTPVGILCTVESNKVISIAAAKSMPKLPLVAGVRPIGSRPPFVSARGAPSRCSAGFFVPDGKQP